MDPQNPSDSDPSEPGPARQREADRAAQEVVAPDRLLPGEEPDSHLPEDALHWIAVYSELLQFKQQMLRELERAMVESVTPEARAEIEGTDVRVAQAEAERFARRLGFWRRRAEELEKHSSA